MSMKQETAYRGETAMRSDWGLTGTFLPKACIGRVVEGIVVLAMVQAHCPLSPSKNVCFLWYTVEVLGQTSNLQCHKPKAFVHGVKR